MKRATIILSVLIISLAQAIGQVIDFSTPVDIKFNGDQLETVLLHLEKEYDIQFSYSRNLIPLEQPMYIDLEQVQCKEALDELFLQTQIVYGFIGEQIVLAIDTQKVATVPDHNGSVQEFEEEAWASTDLELPIRNVRVSHQLPNLEINRNQVKSQQFSARYVIDIEPETEEVVDQSTYFERLEEDINSTIVHLSVFSPLGYRFSDADDQPTNLGLHLTWGLDPSLDGVGFAGIGHSVSGNARGAQFSSIFNTVGGEFSGGQFSGVANINTKQTRGASFAGVANYSKDLEGGQLAGVMNISTGEAEGLQAAGVLNIAAKGNSLSQIAGVTNFGLKKTDIQIAGVTNIGGHVTKGQISGILNVARKVDGFQIGLFNFADTVKGPAIGLLSIVKSGYHSIGVSGQESLHANAFLRLGTRPFYNIIRFGARTDEETWGLGYGVGTSIPMGRRNFLQIEAMATHVNEREIWTNQLNLLNQLNLIANIKLGKHFGLAIGPTFNVSVSEVYRADTDTYGMGLGSNYLFNETSYKPSRNPINVRGWIGFNVGIRFDSR